MIPRVSISSDRVEVDDVWEHYEAVRAAIVRLAESAKQSLIEGTDRRDPRFFGMNLTELDEYFESLLNEADHQTCLFLVAGAEAAIHVDFLERVYERRKDRVSRAFRDIYNTRCGHNKTRVRLEEDILDTWASEISKAKPTIGTFKSALKFRHWLAHGRWWVPKLGRKYDPAGVVQIIMDLFGAIEISTDV